MKLSLLYPITLLFFVLQWGFPVHAQPSGQGAVPGFNPAQMSGIPRPDPEVPSQTITVRLIQGDFQNKLVGVSVELHSLENRNLSQTGITDETGRTTFSKLSPGAYQAEARFAKEHLVSQPIEVNPAPASGIRVMLVFSKASALPSPFVRNIEHLYIGGDSNLRIEFQTDNIIQIDEQLFLENPLSSSIDPGPNGLEIPLAQGAELPQAFVADPNIVLSLEQKTQDRPPAIFWKGPISPGRHLIEVAFLLQATAHTFHFHQVLPIAWQAPILVMEQNSHLTFVGETFQNPRTIITPEGHSVLGTIAKADIPPSTPVRFELTLVSSQWVPIIASLAAGFVMLIFVFISLFKKSSPVSTLINTKQLLLKREELFHQLLMLEKGDGQIGTCSEEIEVERKRIFDELAALYQQLEQEPPPV